MEKITHEEYLNALEICINYKLQINELNEVTAEQLRGLKLNTIKHRSRNINLETDISKVRDFMTNRLKHLIDIYANYFHLEIEKIIDLSKIDLDKFSSLRGVGKGSISELNQIKKMFKI